MATGIYSLGRNSAAGRCRRKGSGKKVPAIRFQPTNQTNPVTSSTSTIITIIDYLLLFLLLLINIY